MTGARPWGVRLFLPNRAGWGEQAGQRLGCTWHRWLWVRAEGSPHAVCHHSSAQLAVGMHAAARCMDAGRVKPHRMLALVLEPNKQYPPAATSVNTAVHTTSCGSGADHGWAGRSAARPDYARQRGAACKPTQAPLRSLHAGGAMQSVYRKTVQAIPEGNSRGDARLSQTAGP